MASNNYHEKAMELLKGAVEMHVHLNPHIRPEAHIMDALEYVRQARDAGMKGVAIKDAGLPTTGAAYVINKLVPGIEVYGTAIMNVCNGGLNPEMVATVLEHGDGVRLIYCPTGDSLHHIIAREKFYVGINPPTPKEKGISISEQGKLKPVMKEILKLIAEKDRCMATGHLAPNEVKILVDEALKMGINRILVSHAMWKMIGHNHTDLAELAKKGAFIEFEYGICMPLMLFIHAENPANPWDMVKLMRNVGIEKSVMTTDFGQAYSPHPIDGMRYFIATLLKCGMEEDEIRQMVSRNPAYLLGISI